MLWPNCSDYFFDRIVWRLLRDSDCLVFVVIGNFCIPLFTALVWVVYVHLACQEPQSWRKNCKELSFVGKAFKRQKDWLLGWGRLRSPREARELLHLEVFINPLRDVHGRKRELLCNQRQGGWCENHHQCYDLIHEFWRAISGVSLHNIITAGNTPLPVNCAYSVDRFSSIRTPRAFGLR